VVAPPAGQGRTAVGPVTDGGGDEAVRLGRVRLLAGVVTGGRHGGGEPPAGEVVGGGGGGRNKVSEEEDDIKWASLGRAFGCVLIFRKEDRSPPPRWAFQDQQSRLIYVAMQSYEQMQTNPYTPPIT
jgi:hypothetical protein